MDDIAVGPERTYLDWLAQGRFMLQRSRTTDEYVFFPRTVAPRTGASDLEWVEASGEGTVYSTTVVRRRAEHGGDYNVVLVDLKEGPRMMSKVVGVAPEQVHIGMPVMARIEASDPPVVIFEAVTGPGA